VDKSCFLIKKAIYYKYGYLSATLNFWLVKSALNCAVLA